MNTLHPRLLTPLMQDAIDRLELSLAGAVVLTEAASGPYVVTPVLAAMAGAAEVFAVTRDTRYGSFDQVAEQTRALAECAGVAKRLHILREKRADILERADVVTNSGHLRPLDTATIERLKPSAVIPLMYESWELRDGDLDLEACRRKGIRVAGTNECHDGIDVFSFLGVMAAQLLFEAGIAVYKTRLLLLCDNPFAPYMKRSLERMGADLDVAERLPEVTETQPHQAIVVAMLPGPVPRLSSADAQRIARYWPRATVAQFWGDIDREGFAASDVPVAPAKTPPAGHMGVLPSAVGPDPTIRLQSGGLKVAEVLLKNQPSTADLAYIQTVKF